eukprot:gene30613-38074_t
MLDVIGKPAWQGNFFTGVPAPAGAMLVMLPVYLGFLGLAPTRPLAFAGAAYTVCVAILMISRLPVFSGKAAGTKLRSDWVMPSFLFIVVYVAFLMSYTWQTLTLTTVGFFLSLPFSAR